ncbi:FHA domain-containing protein [Streptomyces sp. WAC01280]|uniref:FHA domain-containing protein n=1 Tax=Streptomyces sp. WAC01280 TaxID=2487424 RepID=UPI000F78186C|nr:FHA domain-containing protein [Streptomyces sp. WAC01280]RSS56523.1 FHA domain-containing protein [Streptomyces sp. WAC01280]
MASLTRYRCPVTPDDCPTSESRGFCAVHEWDRLVPERVLISEELNGSGEPGGLDVTPPGEVESPPRPPWTPPPRPEPKRPPIVRPTPVRSSTVRLALVLAGVLVPLRGEGEAPTRLGRDAPDCAHVTGLDLLDQISREHAEFFWESGQLYVRDTCSSNGTFVDGERIEGHASVWPGSHEVRLAQDVDLVIVEIDEFGAPL